ncbi:MAG: CBS domain-containing protein [Burkholderiales bacterium]|nr:CBS domain-containing protein [Burkholderiales bacterium]
MKARDLMTTQVVSVGLDAHMATIVKILIERRISGVFVVDAGRVVGSVGEADLLHRYEIGTQDAVAARTWWSRLAGTDRPSAAYVKTHGEHARDFMNPQVVPVSEDTPIAAIASIFDARSIRRVAVLRGEQLIGVVTRADLVKALANRKEIRPPAGSTNDEAIRIRLLWELRGQPWWQPQSSAVFVSHGVVKYVGLYEHGDDREAARVLAESIPGVQGVSDVRVCVADGESMI